MYEVQVKIQGTAPLLQHKFGADIMEAMMQGSRKNTGSPDWSAEWMGTMYADKAGYLYQPATHIEGALVKAATSFKIKGQKSKTWKDPIKAYVYVSPDNIPHLFNGEPVKAPNADLVLNPTENLSVSIMRAVVQRAAIARSRLMIAIGWELAFTIQVVDDQVRAEVLREILEEAGRAVGIGDYRPRYGRFQVVTFEVK